MVGLDEIFVKNHFKDGQSKKALNQPLNDDQYWNVWIQTDNIWGLQMLSKEWFICRDKQHWSDFFNLERHIKSDINFINSPNIRIKLFNSSSFQSFGKDKTGRGHIPDWGSCPLSTQLMEDKLRHPVQPSVPLHLLSIHWGKKHL